MSESTEWLTVREAAAELGLTKETVARMGRRGEIPIDRPGPRMSRVRRADVDAYIESCRITPGSLGVAGPDDSDGSDDPVLDDTDGADWRDGTEADFDAV